METITKNLDALLTFHVVASEGSLTQAAQKLGVSKSMVSKLVKRLETYLSIQLFHRTTRTLHLTKEGRVLFGYSKRIVHLSDEAEFILKDLTQGDKGTIRISAPVGLGHEFFPSFLREISKKLPDVKFCADISNEMRDLAANEIDFAIRATREPQPEIIARYLGHVRDVICVTPNFNRIADIANDPRELAKAQCVQYESNHEWNTWIFSSGKDEVRVEISGRYVVNTYQAALKFCLNNLGVARLPYYIAAEALSQKRLIQLFPKYEILTHPLYLIYLRAGSQAKKYQLAKQSILDWFESRPRFFSKHIKH